MRGAEVLSFYGKKLLGEIPPYLLESPGNRQQIERWSNVPNSIRLSLRELIAGRRNFQEILQPLFDHRHTEVPANIFRRLGKSVNHIIETGMEGLEFIHWMDIADRTTNGLREFLKIDKEGKESKFGAIYFQAMENPDSSDHNYPHNRRIERWIEAFLLNIGKLRHEQSLMPWIDSMFLYGYFHDVDQVLSLQRNQSLPKENQFNVKKGHALAGAVMILAMHKRYAEVSGLRTNEAWRRSAGAAFMILKHDEPERFMNAISARQPAYKIIDDEKILLFKDELMDLFNKNVLDLVTLSPSQLVDLLKMVKEKNGFLGNESAYGLLPEFEQEFAEELRELAGNNEPLFIEISPSERQSLNIASEVAVRADLMDMISPPAEAMLRSLLTQWSEKRPFFRTEVNDNDLINSIMEGEGNLDTNDSDVRRLLWEFVHNDEFHSESPVGRSRFKKKVYKDNALTGLLMFQRIGSRLLRGDFTDVERVYEFREDSLIRKAFLKSGINPFRTELVLGKLKKVYPERDRYVQSVTTYLGNLGQNQTVANNLPQELTDLVYEKDNIIYSYERKTKQHRYQYADSDISRFNNICEAVLNKLIQTHQVSHKQLRKYRRMVAKYEYPATVPYRSYDSLGGKPRTLVNPDFWKKP
jgi:hypothetical protein